MRFLGGEGLGKAAIFKSRATPANPGAEADLAGGPGALARGQLAGHRGQPAKHDVAQAVAQKLAAAVIGNRRTFVHGSTVCMNIRHLAERGLPSFVQPLTFLAPFLHRYSSSSCRGYLWFSFKNASTCR